MKTQMGSTLFVSLVSVLIAGCSVTKNAQNSHEKVLTQSAFFPGTRAAGFDESQGEEGFISGPGESSGNDAGSIQDPASSSASGGETVPSGTSSTAPLAESSPISGGSTTSGSEVSAGTSALGSSTAGSALSESSGTSGASSSSVSMGGTDQGFIAGSQEAGSDGGQLTGSINPISGNGNATSGALSVDGPLVATNSGPSGATPVASSDASGTTASSSSASSGPVEGPVTNTASSVGGSDSGAIAVAPTAGNDGGQLISGSSGTTSVSTNVESPSVSATPVATSNPSGQAASPEVPATSLASMVQSLVNAITSVVGATQEGTDSGAIPGPVQGGGDGGNTGGPVLPQPSPSANPLPTPIASSTPSLEPQPTPGVNPQPTPMAILEPGPGPIVSPPFEHPIDIEVGRVCSAYRSTISYPQFIFFEEAKNPRLTLELVQNSNGCSCQCSCVSPVPVNRQTSKSDSVLVSLDLSEVDLSESRFQTMLDLKLSKVKALYPMRWRRLYAKVMVCEDRNRNNRCSDETGARMLSVNSPTFTLDRIPPRLAIDVWNGRNKTRSKDPEVCEKQYSPLVLDLAGNGFSLSSAENGVSFDLNATGRAVSTAWTQGSDDAFLVYDRNGNGRIDDGGELFGSATLLKSGKRALNGFEALRDLDDNRDETFDERDETFFSVRLWIDRNHNAISERNELVTLGRTGVTGIRLDYSEVSEVDPFGNQTRQRSTFKRQSRGRQFELQIIDIWFVTLVNH